MRALQAMPEIASVQQHIQHCGVEACTSGNAFPMETQQQYDWSIAPWKNSDTVNNPAASRISLPAGCDNVRPPITSIAANAGR